MYLTSNFQFKPVNPEKILKQYKRLNSKIPSASQVDRESILKYMTGYPLEVLSHEVVSNGRIRRPITGVTVIKDSQYQGFPASHVAYVASSPTKSPLAINGAVDDLATNLIQRLGDDGMFDLTPNNSISRQIYQSKLGVDASGTGSVRGIKNARRKNRSN